MQNLNHSLNSRPSVGFFFLLVVCLTHIHKHAHTHTHTTFATCVCVSHSVASNSLRPHGLSTGFSRQEYWSGLPFPSPGDLPEPGIKPGSPTLQADSLPSESPGKPHVCNIIDLEDLQDPERGGRAVCPENEGRTHGSAGSLPPRCSWEGTALPLQQLLWGAGLGTGGSRDLPWMPCPRCSSPRG